MLFHETDNDILAKLICFKIKIFKDTFFQYFFMSRAHFHNGMKPCLFNALVIFLEISKSTHTKSCYNQPHDVETAYSDLSCHELIICALKLVKRCIINFLKLHSCQSFSFITIHVSALKYLYRYLT